MSLWRRNNLLTFRVRSVSHRDLSYMHSHNAQFNAYEISLITHRSPQLPKSLSVCLQRPRYYRGARSDCLNIIFEREWSVQIFNTKLRQILLRIAAKPLLRLTSESARLQPLETVSHPVLLHPQLLTFTSHYFIFTNHTTHLSNIDWIAGPRYASSFTFRKQINPQWPTDDKNHTTHTCRQPAMLKVAMLEQLRCKR